MNYERDTTEMLRKRLKEAMNHVPDSVRNGSVQETRSWLAMREEAVRMLRRPNATASELLGMIGRLK